MLWKIDVIDIGKDETQMEQSRGTRQGNGKCVCVWVDMGIHSHLGGLDATLAHAHDGSCVANLRQDRKAVQLALPEQCLLAATATAAP